MKKPTKVSVIVPIYNVERYLPQCLDSIKTQTHNNLDIVLVDDGSTDKSASIADDYAANDPRIRVIHKVNEGVSKARNTGIDMANGEYICFVDAYDFVTNDYVTYLLAMAKGNDVDVALTTSMYSTFNMLTNINGGGE